jgi:hypothetical protein
LLASPNSVISPNSNRPSPSPASASASATSAARRRLVSDVQEVYASSLLTRLLTYTYVYFCVTCLILYGVMTDRASDEAVTSFASMPSIAPAPGDAIPPTISMPSSFLSPPITTTAGLAAAGIATGASGMSRVGSSGSMRRSVPHAAMVSEEGEDDIHTDDDASALPTTSSSSSRPFQHNNDSDNNDDDDDTNNGNTGGKSVGLAGTATGLLRSSSNLTGAATASPSPHDHDDDHDHSDHE